MNLNGTTNSVANRRKVKVEALVQRGSHSPLCTYMQNKNLLNAMEPFKLVLKRSGRAKQHTFFGFRWEVNCLFGCFEDLH